MMGWVLLALACMVAGYAMGHRDGMDKMRGKRKGPRL